MRALRVRFEAASFGLSHVHVKALSFKIYVSYSGTGKKLAGQCSAGIHLAPAWHPGATGPHKEEKVRHFSCSAALEEKH